MMMATEKLIKVEYVPSQSQEQVISINASEVNGMEEDTCENGEKKEEDEE